ncbi:hypothetical protein [Streptomyces sp. NPDC088915]|uniref:hypothetical protein n=1 Tax=Streptomyces sp. NPDC088915 TaxID=3365912 RepID=UPI003822C56D
MTETAVTPRTERTRLNVRGPFYGAGTDTCGTGRIHGPGPLLYEADRFTAYVYRQPRTPRPPDPDPPDTP